MGELVQEAEAAQLHRSHFRTNCIRKRSLEAHGSRPDAQVVFLLPVVLAPLVIVVISLAERRFGPAVAGRLNAIPLSIALAVLGVAADRGARAGADVAEAAAAHVPAQVAFAIAFAAVIARAGSVAAGGDAVAAGGDASRRRLARVVAGLAAATAAFAALSLVIATLPPGVAIAAALPALALGRYLLDGGNRVAEDREGGAAELLARAVVALIFILAVLTAVRTSGPSLGGAIAAFPALTATLAVMIGRTRGPVAVGHLLAGVVQGLTGYLAFCVALAFAAPGLGLAAAPLAAAACAAAYAASLRGVTLRAA
jgi:hypothetical protein